jgi:hypothetical protein
VTGRINRIGRLVQHIGEFSLVNREDFSAWLQCSAQPRPSEPIFGKDYAQIQSDKAFLAIGRAAL